MIFILELIIHYAQIHINYEPVYFLVVLQDIYIKKIVVID